jgi:D-alanyl-D-alanine carboxypeptidase/D-alanyl-D-alanine-endopeptidase (penicillin-binding protein 4)
MIGQPVNVAVSPATDYVHLNNRAVSGPANNYAITRQHGTNLLQLTGTLAPATQPSVGERVGADATGGQSV